MTALAAGTYAITVRDVSAKDNFHLSESTGLDRKTSVAGGGRVLWRLALKPGTYRYRSDAHPQLKGSLTVTQPAAVAFVPQDTSTSTLLDGSFQAAVSGSSNATLELIDPVTGQISSARPPALSRTRSAASGRSSFGSRPISRARTTW